MKSVKVKFDDVSAIKDFVNIISPYDVDFEFIQGRYIVDAKSIMGVLGLDFSDNVTLNINSDDEKILESISCFIV